MKPLFILTTIINGVTVIIEVYAVGMQAVYSCNGESYCTGLTRNLYNILYDVDDRIQSITQPITTI